MAMTKRQRLERQRYNTERWFDSNPGKKEEQAMKARIRMANLRLKRKRESDAANTRSSSEPLDFTTTSDDDDDDEASAATSLRAAPGPHQNPAMRSLRESRIDITNWGWNLGAESTWEHWVVEEFRLAAKHDTLEALCEAFRLHALKGRELLRGVQLLCHVLLPGSSVEEMQDLFLQSHDLTVVLLSEIKFVEVKLNEYIYSLM